MTNDSIDNCSEFQPLVAAYALGEQPPDAELAAHLEQCANCRRDLSEYARVGTLLAYDAPAAEPVAEKPAKKTSKPSKPKAKSTKAKKETTEPAAKAEPVVDVAAANVEDRERDRSFVAEPVGIPARDDCVIWR